MPNKRMNPSYGRTLGNNFFIGCFYAGIAGALLAHWVGFMNAEQFSLIESIENQSFILAFEALHPRDYTERYHIGGEYQYNNVLAVRAGYKFIKIYANYGMVPLFTKNGGPELYPFNVGLILFSF